MKVLFDAHQLGRRQTGNETYVRELLPHLCATEGIDVTAVVENPVATEYVRTVGAEPYSVAGSGWARLVALGVAARRRRMDLVHSIYYLPPGMRRATVVTIHDISFEMHPEFFRRADLLRNRTLVRLAARLATIVVTVSEASRGDIVERYGIDPARVIAIHNGVSPVFAPPPSPRLPSSSGPFRILAVGTLQPRKNLLRLLEAVRLVAQSHDVSLRIVGPAGYQANEIRIRLGNVPWVETSGYLPMDELLHAYHDADLFVYPSIYEGFGLPVVEAMASGTPVVTSTGGSLPEIAGDAAIVVDPTDIDAIANAILRVVESPDLQERLRTRGIARAAAFSWARSAEDHISAYEAALLGP